MSQFDTGIPDSAHRAFKVIGNKKVKSKLRSTLEEMVAGYSTNFEYLSIEMADHFESRRQPKEEFDRKMALCELLKKVIRKHNPSWVFEIVPTGSSVTGLATKDSDLDVAIHIPQAAKSIPQFGNKDAARRRIQLDILQIVRRILTYDEEICEEIEEGMQLVQAQIQILKLTTLDGIECDISVVLDLFLSSMHNSLLIRHLSAIDNRFAPLCAIVKQWADSTKVKNPKEGGFNSYALVLLVIHFLQCQADPPILPNLQVLYKDDNFIAFNEKQFPKRIDFGAPLPRPIPKIQRNMFPVAVLFLQFLHYYANFDFTEHYISIPYATVANRKRASDRKIVDESNKKVYIEDPFDDHNPGRTVQNIAMIKAAFRETMMLFVCEKNNSEFQFPTIETILNMQPPSPNQKPVENEEPDNGYRMPDPTDW